MKRLMILSAGLALSAASVAPLRAAGLCERLPARSRMPLDAIPAIPPGVANWAAQVDILAKRPPAYVATRKLVFVGDSLTYNWPVTLFQQTFGNWSPITLGVYGDRTEGVLKRLPDELGSVQPQLVVLLIGTNNTDDGRPPADVALGIAEIVRQIHGRLPETKVLIVGILPRGRSPSPLRLANDRVNGLVAECADDVTTFYTDVGGALLAPDRTLTRAVSEDATHLTPAGYQLYADALKPVVQRLMAN